MIDSSLEMIAIPPENDIRPGGWAESALALLLADSRSVHTKRAYARDLRDFFALYGKEPDAEAVRWLCTHESGALALLLNGYKAFLRQRGLSEATINRRLAAVRALLRFSRRLGAHCPDPATLVTGEKVRPYRDTRGPGIEAIARILAAIDRRTIVGLRDYALIRLLSENALRRGEVERANLGDFDGERRRLLIIGKGRGSQKEPITLSAETATAIENYRRERRRRGEEVGPNSPLFVSNGRGIRAREGRLTGRGIALIVARYGERVLGIPLHPHALRHTAITATLDATGGDMRIAQRLSRHRDLRTLAIYDDNREDLQGKATDLLSIMLSPGTVDDRDQTREALVPHAGRDASR